MAPPTHLDFTTLWPYLLGALSVLLLLSGADDLVPLLVCTAHWARKAAFGRTSAIENASPAYSSSERRIAILVPCWRESEVIGNMVRHNQAAIRYRNFDFFLGVYPNDEPTVLAADELAAAFPNVHVAMCPGPGPTSKADCLNTAYRRMQEFEHAHGLTVDTVVLHDAEDLIHQQALSVINRERARFDMVQVPVLPLPTGWSDVTHGVYCDEFAEYQTIDMRARELMKSFVPSNGVGTGFSRRILDELASTSTGKVFDEASLTEDYEIGVRFHAAGYRQTFVPLTHDRGEFIATREFFPRTMNTAVRQRTRWVTGIALQCWERHGWGRSLAARYWFWRDRKGLLANPLSVLANVLFIGGLIDFLGCAMARVPWHLTVQSRLVALLCVLTTGLQCLRLTMRAACVAQIYGWATAIGVPLRSFHANLINTLATAHALLNYARARRHNRRLTWQKTEHAYPPRELLHGQRRELSEILLVNNFLTEEQLERVAAGGANAPGLDLLLLAGGVLGEEQLCRALSLQSGIAVARVEVSKVSPKVARGLPASLQKRGGVVPFAVREGKMMMATWRVPGAEVLEELTAVSKLPVEIRLVTQTQYRALEQLL